MKPGSVIYTNLWKGYARLEQEKEYNFKHGTVNHSRFFKDPITGVHTNTIEGIWNGVKTHIMPRNRTKGIAKHLSKYLWRRNNKVSLWDSMILILVS